MLYKKEENESIFMPRNTGCLHILPEIREDRSPGMNYSMKYGDMTRSLQPGPWTFMWHGCGKNWKKAISLTTSGPSGGWGISLFPGKGISLIGRENPGFNKIYFFLA
jgi:hypothetical protein